MNYDEFLAIPPYSLNKKEKQNILLERLKELTEFHSNNCEEYRKILELISYDNEQVNSVEDLPFIPVRLFKERTLRSVPQGDVVKTMTSSGTSGQNVSKIYLDKETSRNQQRTMVKIVNEFTGTGRMPMIILDCPSVVKDRRMFSARGAGILGFSLFGSKIMYALTDDMKLNVEALQEFIERYKGERIFLFGFTFMIWQYFYKEMLRLKQEGITVDLSNGILIHGGGWKKLQSEAVNPAQFQKCLYDVCGIRNVHDYYGMVEQTGCIYMQCECGHLHASIFSDVIIRNPKDFSVCKEGEKGIVQVVSAIPESYPGHSILTEDEGVILGEDNCPCGRKGKYFKIEGRLKSAEVRGCSDTYAEDFSRKNISNIISPEKDVLQRIEYLLGDEQTIKKISKQTPLRPFSDDIIAFLDSISKGLMSNPNARGFSDVVSLGFWLRKSSTKQMRKRFEQKDGNIHVGRGVTFHIAPSNVPVNYAYSLFTAILCGNACIVRVSSKDFPQVKIINHAISKALESFPQFKPYICLVRYDRDFEINQLLSGICDTRIIWGGDLTIEEVRKARLSPRATEIAFADRYSLAFIDSDSYLKLDDKEKVALDFYNDTYLTDQNACTSPRVVVWLGKNTDMAKEIFWQQLRDVVEKRYRFQSIMGVDKYSTSCAAVTGSESEIADGMRLLLHSDNLIYRIKVSKLNPKLMDYRGSYGLFYEYDCGDVLELTDFCNDTHCQTISLIGDKSLVQPLLEQGIKGVDRVVQVGHTMDFDLNWDGFNLVEQLTRTVTF